MVYFIFKNVNYCCVNILAREQTKAVTLPHCWKWVLYTNRYLMDCIFFCSFFFLFLTESILSIFYSLLCPLNTSFRPSPVRFSAHIWNFFFFFFFTCTHLVTANSQQRMWKNGCNEPTQVIYANDIQRDNVALLKTVRFLTTFSQIWTLKGFKMYFLT